jgi:hypothetical protein
MRNGLEIQYEIFTKNQTHHEIKLSKNDKSNDCKAINEILLKNKKMESLNLSCKIFNNKKLKRE